jgi:hypothetical protein
MFTRLESLRLFLWGYLKRLCVLHHPAHFEELQVEIEAGAEEITGGMLQLTTVWFAYSESTRLKDLSEHVFI